MISDKILPAHLLAGYIWNLWQNNTSPSIGTIAGRNGQQLARIAPVTDEPDLSDSGETYILYGFAENESDKLPVHHTGTFAMRVKSNDFAELGQLIRIIDGAFEVEDEAAYHVNLWTSTHSPMIGIRFTSVCKSYVEAADAATTEGGNIEGAINLRYRYVIDSHVKTYQPNGIWS